MLSNSFTVLYPTGVLIKACSDNPIAPAKANSLYMFNHQHNEKIMLKLAKYNMVALMFLISLLLYDKTKQIKEKKIKINSQAELEYTNTCFVIRESNE